MYSAVPKRLAMIDDVMIPPKYFELNTWVTPLSGRPPSGLPLSAVPSAVSSC